MNLLAATCPKCGHTAALNLHVESVVTCERCQESFGVSPPTLDIHSSPSRRSEGSIALELYIAQWRLQLIEAPEKTIIELTDNHDGGSYTQAWKDAGEMLPDPEEVMSFVIHIVENEELGKSVEAALQCGDWSYISEISLYWIRARRGVLQTFLMGMDDAQAGAPADTWWFGGLNGTRQMAQFYGRRS